MHTDVLWVPNPKILVTSVEQWHDSNRLVSGGHPEVPQGASPLSIARYASADATLTIARMRKSKLGRAARKRK